MSLSESQKGKKRLRSSKKWLTLRHLINVEQNGIDPITQKKLTRQCNLHHLNLREEDYDKLDNHEHFVMLNKQTHECVHFLYKYYCKDKGVIERLRVILDKMVEINNGNLERDSL